MDWNDQKYCEIWRHEWEVIQNRYLEANDRPERVDLRSYARQGLDIIPTVHEGAAVRQMEKRGIQTNIGNLNREIRAANRLMKSIRQLMASLIPVFIPEAVQAPTMGNLNGRAPSPTMAAAIPEMYYLCLRCPAASILHREACGALRVSDPHLHPSRRTGRGHLRWLRHNRDCSHQHRTPLCML